MGRVEQLKEYGHEDEAGNFVVEGTYAWDSYYVEDALLSTYSTETLQLYDVSGFGVPITDLALAKRLDGLTSQSIRISRNFEQSARLNEFYDRFIEPAEITYEFDGEQLTFRDSEINLFGERGSMIHLRRQSPDTVRAEVPLRMLTVISHIDDAQPATITTATRFDPKRYDSTHLSVYRVGTPADPSLQLVDRPTAFEWDVEQLLQADEAVTAQAEIEVTGNGMRYRRSDRQWEMCSELETFRRRVGIALSRGLGYAAMPFERQAEQADIGQLQQKVLG